MGGNPPPALQGPSCGDPREELRLGCQDREAGDQGQVLHQWSPGKVNNESLIQTSSVTVET